MRINKDNIEIPPNSINLQSGISNRHSRTKGYTINGNVYNKIGIDTSVIISLIVKEINLFKFKEKEFSANDSLYYAMKTKYEFRGVILNRYGYDKKEKNKLWKRAKNSLGLNPIKIGKRDISDCYEKVQKAREFLIRNNTRIELLKPQDLHLRNLPTSVREKANSNLDGFKTEGFDSAQNSTNFDMLKEPENTPRTSVRGFLTYYKIGEEDVEIIANFLKWGINKVYTSDKAFYETCKILGLDTKFLSNKDYYQMEKRL